MSRNRNPELAAALAARNLTAKELASHANLHPATISRVFNGHQTLSAATAARLAGILGSTPEALGLVEVEEGAE